MSTRSQVQVTYDVSNDFFRLWLDESMSYSCAVFGEGDDLEAAQQRKLAFIADCARVAPGMSVLDIGCGWGANLDHLVRERGVRHAIGITLSAEQHAYVQQREIPRSRAELVSHRDFEPEESFDAVTSVGMFEHLVTPQQARAGRATDVYRDYFARAWRWSASGAWFGLQTIVQARIPRRREHLRELGWMTYTIFPGAVTPRLESIFASLLPYYEVRELVTRREDYARTTAEWLARLHDHEDEIRERFGDERFEEYDRYLRACVMGFEEGYLSLAQLALRRIDGPSAARPAARGGST